MQRRMTLAGIALLLALTVAGCDEKLSELTGPTPNLEPTFTSIQQEISAAPTRRGGSPVPTAIRRLAGTRRAG